ncbi:hypothetical protein HDR66_02795, partial [bacterium]|nr:hypothetical protein [bacterium]
GAFKNVNLSRRNNALYQDLKEYGKDLPASLVQQRFAEYPVTHTESVGNAWLGGHGLDAVADNFGNFLGGGGGIQARRWIEAGILIGEIDPQMLLDCPMGAVSLFFKRVGRARANWFTGDAPNRRLNRAAFAEFREWLRNPVDTHGYSLAYLPKVKDYLPEYAREMCESGLCQIGNKEFDATFNMVANETSNETKAIQYSFAAKKIKKNANRARYILPEMLSDEMDI